MSNMWQRADFWPADRPASPGIDDFARGLVEGRRTVEAELASERAALLQLAAALETLQPPSPVRIASLLITGIERLVTDIAGQVPVDSALLRERANALAAVIATEGDIVLALHPDDAALLDTVLPVVSDPTLQRGTVQARIGSATYEDGVGPALDRLRDAIDRLGLAS